MTREKSKQTFDWLYESGFTKEDVFILLNKIYDDFEKKIDNQISYLEDCGWYEFDDKEQAIKAMYELRDTL